MCTQDNEAYDVTVIQIKDIPSMEVIELHEK